MRRVFTAGGIVAAVALTAGTAMASNFVEIYPNSQKGWGVPGPAPDGNGGGFTSGTTTTPFAAVAHGRASYWVGNDGGVNDANVIDSLNAAPIGTGGGGQLYQGVAISSVTGVSMTMYREGINPVTLAPIAHPSTGGMLFYIDDPDDSRFAGTAFARILPRMMNYTDRYEAAGGVLAGGISTSYADWNSGSPGDLNDTWRTWTVDSSTRYLEFWGNVFGSGTSTDFWDGTGSPQSKMVSLSQIAAWEPDLVFDDGTNQAWSYAVEVSNNVFGANHSTYWDEFSISFGGGNPNGDANMDGTVNGLDLSIMASNWLAAVGGGSADGDFNTDGTVNGLDLSILASNWLAVGGSSTDTFDFTTGPGGGSGGGVSFDEALAAVGLGGIPEPSSMLLLGAGSLLLMRRRRA